MMLINLSAYYETSMMKKRILVTGGAGFIGSHLTKKLLDTGCEVIVVDNLHTGHLDNLQHLLRDENLKIIRHDVTEPYQFDVDYIYNLACPASPIHYQCTPVKTVLTCVQGVIHGLQLAKDINARILQASTSEIYGDAEQHPQSENYWGNVNSIGPRSCYDEGKRVAETLMFDYYREEAVDIRIARIFNTFGPNLRPNDGRVISNFILQALRGDPITVFGDGSQTRSFCFVDDLVEGLVGLMEQEAIIGPINLGNPDERSIKEIAELIIMMTQSSSEILYGPLPQNDPVRRKPDIRLAREQLNWYPVVSLEKGLEQTIAYFRPFAAK